MDEQTINADFSSNMRVRCAQIANVVITLAENISDHTETPACAVFQEIIKAAVGALYVNGHEDCADALLAALLEINDIPEDASIN